MQTITNITTLYPHPNMADSIKAAAEAGWRIDCAANPIESARTGLTPAEACEVAAQDSALLSFYSEVDGPMREIVFARLEEAIAHGDADTVAAAVWSAWPFRPYAQEDQPSVSAGLLQRACRLVRDEERRLDDGSCRDLPPFEG